MKKIARKKVSRFSWLEYIIVLLLLAFFSALPGLMYGLSTGVLEHVFDYLGWYLLYWAIIAGIFCGYTAYEKYRRFDVPMNRLSEATKKVAEGDFSVYLKPMHTSDQLDYVDNMFLDFNVMVKELGSLETMKTDFISNVSHEIKTPLAIIQNYASAIQDEHITAEERQEYIQTLQTASKNLSKLVMNILSLNKLENQGIVVPDEPFDICRHLSDCVLSYESLWEEKEITLIADIEDRAYVQTDEQMIEIIWRNLLSNAIKFTDKKGTISVKQYSTDKEVIVEIADNGCGMDEETQKRLLEKFYQGDTSHSKEGNGLGMALVARVIDLVEGELLVDSQLGKGTTFTVKLKTIQ